ncbi:MAG: flippase-like domain-containing protein [Deltaproteobacteria bacterium]|nr:flippase-like domain-containing protein [Deltaproteobacteria bacterium]MBW2361422.1 flippase-like domain-containing protein [Deltaproteobacteria bacterium]
MSTPRVASIERDGSSRGGPRWLPVLKFVVTLGILTALLTQVDMAQLGAAIRSSLGPWLALALAANSLMLLTSTVKWERLLRSVGIVQRFGALLRLYTIGFFFSSFLPGTVGGDVVRWHAASATPDLRLRVAGTILAERVTGAVALVLLCVLLVGADAEHFATAPTLLLLAGLGSALAGGLWLAWNPRLAELLARGARGRAGWVLRPVAKLHAALTGIPTPALLASVAWSLPFYVSAGLLFYLISLAFGVQLSFVEAATVQVLICLLTLVPISLGGLGLAQAGDVYLLGLLGIEPATALGMSFLRQAICYAYAALGAVLFAGWTGHPSVAELRSLPDASMAVDADAGGS